ncbi:MAG: response regulator [Nitrospirae bacterium]|nr:response regulator [Nitrospirota bacterium]
MEHSILVVDDDPDSWTLLDSILRKQAFTPVWAADGHQAIDLACSHLPEAILLDLGLPEAEGFLVLQRLKSVEQLRRIPVIVVTAQDDAGARAKAQELGAAAFISKPIQREMLLATLQKLLAPAH